MRARLLNARTPDEVFFDREIRVPRREPDESFGYLFFDLVENGRIVGNNGIQYEGRIYRLVSLQKHLEYWGERVDVRVNPDDQREAMIYDRRTGTYVCRALVDMQDATYDTRDEVTRHLIARVFSDGKHLLRMAKSYVEGAQDRLPKYRRAKIEYLVGRAREMEASRKELRGATSETPVTVIGKLSAVAREATHAEPELTPEIVAEILKADARDAKAKLPPEAPLCVVSTRERKTKVRTGRRRHDNALRYSEIAERLGISRCTLSRYRRGINPWPEGMKERFEEYERLRSAMPRGATADVLPGETAPIRPRRTRSDGEFSYANIAKALGMTRKMLTLCKQGKRPWPEGKQVPFEEMQRLRVLSRTTIVGEFKPRDGA